MKGEAACLLGICGLLFVLFLISYARWLAGGRMVEERTGRPVEYSIEHFLRKGL
jgi:hypothetical protein